MPSAYLGIDAGNSKTVAMACLATGEVIGVGRSGCGDIYGTATEAQAVAAVLDAIDGALTHAGIKRDDVGSAAFRLAGIDWPDDHAFWEDTVRREWPDLACWSAANDGYAAIRCGEPSGVGVAVIAGTGAAVAARGVRGELWHMSWWGQHAMGADGLVSEAIKAVSLAELGVAPPTALGPELLAFYGKSSVAEVLEWFTRRHQPATRAEQLSAARTVTAVAGQGDAVAQEIVDEQGRRLALYAEIAARKVGLRDGSRPISVVLTGSVLMAPASPVVDALDGHLREMLPGAVAHRAVLHPVAGAALDAIAEGGLPVTADTAGRLAATAPPAEYFKT